MNILRGLLIISPELQAKRDKFRVQAHTCDRDYMHLKDTVGCAPRVFNDNSAMGIVDMRDAEEGQSFASPSARRSRNALTIERRVDKAVGNIGWFLNMAGRPTPNHLVNPTFQSMGFLNISSFPNDPRPSRFTRCSTEEQCFLDAFTFMGENVDRQSTLNVVGIINRNPASGDKCGGFGILLDESIYPNECAGAAASGHSCCLIDGSVAPLYRMLCGNRKIEVVEEVYDRQAKTIKNQTSTFVNSRAYLNQRCNTRPDGIFATTWGGRLDLGVVDGVCSKLQQNVYRVKAGNTQNDKDLRKAQLGQIRDLLNSIVDAFVPITSVSLENSYLEATACSDALYAALRATTGCSADDVAEIEDMTKSLNPANRLPAGTISPFCTKYHKSTATTTTSFYYFLLHTLQEFPFAWWHKCMALNNRRFSDFAVAGSFSSIQCPEWRSERIVVEDTEVFSPDLPSRCVNFA